MDELCEESRAAVFARTDELVLTADNAGCFRDVGVDGTDCSSVDFVLRARTTCVTTG